MEFWLKSLVPVMNKVCEAGIERKVDKEFWNSILKISGGSGGPYLSGWIVALFPYFGNGYGNQDAGLMKNSYLKDLKGEIKPNSFAGCEMTTAMLPVSVSSCPVLWKYYNKEIDLTLFSGFLATKQEKRGDQIVFSNDIFWALT
mmetsp:Transcript_243/g.211  ORF Transcript_243/g.211 Transcript_243/m.211 type:complete len:144 (-) Transcript_243:158-589(-)